MFSTPSPYFLKQNHKNITDSGSQLDYVLNGFIFFLKINHKASLTYIIFKILSLQMQIFL